MQNSEQDRKLSLALAGALKEHNYTLDLRPGSPADERAVSISMTGDISLVHGVGERLRSEGSRALLDAGPALEADIIMGNLETAVAREAEVNPQRGGMKSPAKLLPYLLELGFDVFCRANNHTMDCGPAGLRETTELLDEAGVKHFGAGEDIDAAARLLVVRRNGLKVGFTGYGQPELDSADTDTPGVNPLLRTRVLEAVMELSSEVDALVVTLHEGFEFSNHPRLEFLDFCREVADAGADIICAHHPHVPQGLEMREGTLILYSLGNFLFDLPYHREYEWTRKGFAAHVTVDAEGPARLTLKPVVLTPQCHLRPAEGEQAAGVLRHIGELSEKLQDRDFIRDANARFAETVVKQILGAPFGFGREGDEEAFDFFCNRQIRRWTYFKAWEDYARLVGGYEPLRESPNN